jgi:hypothetical protein
MNFATLDYYNSISTSFQKIYYTKIIHKQKPMTWKWNMQYIYMCINSEPKECLTQKFSDLPV